MSITISLVNPPSGAVYWMPSIVYGGIMYWNNEYVSLAESETIDLIITSNKVFEDVRAVCYDSSHGIIGHKDVYNVKVAKSYVYDWANNTLKGVGAISWKWIGIGAGSLLGIALLIKRWR